MAKRSTLIGPPLVAMWHEILMVFSLSYTKPEPWAGCLGLLGLENDAEEEVLEQRHMGVGDTIVFLVHWNSRGQPQCSLETC